MSEDIGIKIGTANYGDGGNNWKVQGKGVDNIFRFLPPLGALADEGKWEAGHAGHWGYENSEKKPRCFKCIEVRNPETKEVTTICPECTEHIGVLKAERDKKFNEAVAWLQKNKNYSKDQAERVANEGLKAFDATAGRYNRSYRVYANAINEKEEIGVVNMAFTHLQLLKKEMQEYRKKGIDPLDPRQGVWFNLKYSGSRDHTVKAVYIGSELEGQRLKPGVLTMDVLKRLKNEACLNLASPWEAARLRELNADQIRQLIKSKGDPAVVDSLFSRGSSQKTQKTSDLNIPVDFSSIPGLSDPPAAEVKTETKAEAPKSDAPLSPPDITATDPEFANLFGGMSS